MKTPFERSYWVVPGKFLAGYYPGDLDKDMMSHKLNGLLSVGISTVINLMEPDEINFYGDLFDQYETHLTSLAQYHYIPVECIRFPIRDMGIPSEELMIQILDKIDQAHSKKKSVYVHCLGGVGRTGTVVGCYLIRHGMANSKNVLITISSLMEKSNVFGYRSPQTFDQEEFVFNWGKNGFV
jgi:protein-tyrosine phosphatase